MLCTKEKFEELLNDFLEHQDGFKEYLIYEKYQYMLYLIYTLNPKDIGLKVESENIFIKLGFENNIDIDNLLCMENKRELYRTLCNYEENNFLYYSYLYLDIEGRSYIMLEEGQYTGYCECTPEDEGYDIIHHCCGNCSCDYVEPVLYTRDIEYSYRVENFMPRKFWKFQNEIIFGEFNELNRCRKELLQKQQQLIESMNELNKSLELVKGAIEECDKKIFNLS